MNKSEFSEFHRLLAILIYEYNKMFYNRFLTEETKKDIEDMLEALYKVQKIIILGEDND